MRYEMDLGILELEEDIPGVLPARQRRSIKLRDAYIRAGIEILNTKRLSDLSVSELAQECGGSVGSFYTRTRKPISGRFGLPPFRCATRKSKAASA